MASCSVGEAAEVGAGAGAGLRGDQGPSEMSVSGAGQVGGVDVPGRAGPTEGAAAASCAAAFQEEGLALAFQHQCTPLRAVLVFQASRCAIQ